MTVGSPQLELPTATHARRGDRHQSFLRGRALPEGSCHSDIASLCLLSLSLSPFYNSSDPPLSPTPLSSSLLLAMAAEPPPPAAELLPAHTEVQKPPEKSHSPQPEETAEKGAVLTSFREEETNKVEEEAIDPEKKALDELRQLISAALTEGDFTKPKKEDDPPPPPEETEDPESKAAEPPKKLKDCLEAEKRTSDDTPEGEETKAVVVVEDDGAKTVEAIAETVVKTAVAEEETEEVSLWGVPLAGGGESSDTVLLKFLRARDLNAKEAFAMIKNTIQWRKEFGVEELLEEDLGLAALVKAFYLHGEDREGHPVCYNVYGEFQDKSLYQTAFGDEEKRTQFLRWLLQLLEKEIRRLDFRPNGINTILHVVDLKNSPPLYRKEVRTAYKHALHLLQDNYPEFVAKQIYINVPWWYLAFYTMMSTFMTQRTKSKFVLTGSSKSAETLFKYIAPQHLPVCYGGMDKDGDPDFSSSDAVSQVIVKPCTSHTVVIPAPEACHVVWEIRVLGWDVSYGVEFTPEAEGAYTLVVQKAKRLGSTHDPIEKNSFKVGEPGKIVLSVDNTTSKKKRILLYRFKIKSSTE